MIKYIIKCLVVFFFFWLVYGFTIPNYNWYVTDKVGVFSQIQKEDLTAKIQEIEKATSIEIAILVVPTVDDDINLAAVDVGNKRWVGKKGQNNGLVLLIAVDDRKRSIQVGYGLEWILPDLATKQMWEADFPPNFKQGNYYQGVIQMLDDVLWYIKQDPAILQTYSQQNQQDTSSTFIEKYALYIFFLVLILLSGFGRLVTVPSVKWKKRKMKKYWRAIYAWSGFLIWLIISWFISSIIIGLIISYLLLLFGVLIALFGRTSGWWNGVFFWWWGSFGWWGSSFWWFGGWSFGGGWSSWSR